MRSPSFGLLVGLLLTALDGARALEILHVSHSPEPFTPGRKATAQVRFHLSDPAQVTLKIFDGRDRLVRTVTPGAPFTAGDQSLKWDGRDAHGGAVPPEAYTYALEATGPDGSVAHWDVSDYAGESLEVSGLALDTKRGRITYQLPAMARIRVRIGIAEGGPLMRTLIDWVPRDRGVHEEPWDGRDATGKLDLSKHPALSLDASAFALPRNAILVGPPSAVTSFIDLPADTPTRPRREVDGHRMFDYARQSADARRDFPVRITLPDDLERTKDGVPIVRSAVPIRVDAPEDSSARALNERSEAVFYVDGRFVFERETGFLPFTWTWDPSNHAPGAHYITTNIRGYEGHFGVGTISVWVDSSPNSKSR